MAKTGKLLLNEGSWNGKQIVDSVWVAQVYVPAIKDDRDNYSFGDSTNRKIISAFGPLGQYIVVYPWYNVIAVCLRQNKWDEYDVLVRGIVDLLF